MSSITFADTSANYERVNISYIMYIKHNPIKIKHKVIPYFDYFEILLLNSSSSYSSSSSFFSLECALLF